MIAPGTAYPNQQHSEVAFGTGTPARRMWGGKPFYGREDGGRVRSPTTYSRTRGESRTLTHAPVCPKYGTLEGQCGLARSRSHRNSAKPDLNVELRRIFAVPATIIYIHFIYFYYFSSFHYRAVFLFA